MSTPVNLFDYESLARERLSEMAYGYIASGAADEITLRRNRECFDLIRLKPRVLVDVSQVDTRLELLGQTLDFPILLAPCAYHKLFHPEGEVATAHGAEIAGAVFVVGTFSTVAIEEIAQSTAARLWFQLYVNPDRGFTQEMVERAEAAGCQALCITVDTPILGTRDREKRSGFHLPAGMERANLKQLGAETSRAQHHGQGAYSLLDAALTWDKVDSIRSFTKLPVILKGILAPEDARLAVEHGISGILVSNHGGRNLDTVPAAIEALPDVVEAVQGRCPVLLDGGIRRGTDIVKALALGAKAILIGRPYLWGLAADGAEGIARVIQILRAELEAAMRLCGAPRLNQINRNLLWPDR
ncbi:MAG: alpha-hydroxy-acid oxidizing protein [Acidobacteria bacterium]|nr:alpha-hydroxy-acid oxidizing protein [Acidobacteriota bacterium]